jgi:hypothetical protein
VAIAQTFRKVTQERGRLAEDKVLHCLQDFCFVPDWIKGIRRASLKEDQQGQDVFLLTDVGEMPVQIKSSVAGVRRFRQRYGDRIPVVIVASFDRPEEVLAKIIKAIEPERNYRLEMKNPG